MINDSVQQFLQSQRRTLVSVFPIESKVRCRLATLRDHDDPEGTRLGLPKVRMSGFTEYVLPAAPKGKFTTLAVSGASDIGINLMVEPAQLVVNPVPADAIATELVRQFTSSCLKATTTIGPGIFVAREAEPTDQQILDSPEYAAALKRQEAYFRALIQDADALTLKGQPVTDIHRVAAKWMGVENRPWFKEISEQRIKTCAACGETILAVAVKCRFCQTDLVEWALENGIEQSEDPFVWQRVQARRKAKPQKPVAA